MPQAMCRDTPECPNKAAQFTRVAPMGRAAVPRVDQPCLRLPSLDRRHGTPHRSGRAGPVGDAGLPILGSVTLTRSFSMFLGEFRGDSRGEVRVRVEAGHDVVGDLVYVQ